MFAYDINTADIFNTKSLVNWDQSNLSTLNSQPYSNPSYVNNKKVSLTQPVPISPMKLPPSAFTQVSSSTDSWNTTADAWKATMPEHPHSPPKKESMPHEPVETPTKQNLYKTELCRNWMETHQCRYGPKCQFAHGEDELRGLLRHPKYKTEICRSFHTSGKCSYGNRCRFVHSAAEMRTPEGALLDDNGYSFQQQLAQLKFVDIMPSPNQSLFSSSFIPKEWLAEVDRLQLSERLSLHEQPPHQQQPVSHRVPQNKPVVNPIVAPPLHATHSDSSSSFKSSSPRQQALHALNHVPQPAAKPQPNHSLVMPVPPQSQLSPTNLTIDELPSSAAKSFTFFEEDSDSAEDENGKPLKKSGSTRRLGFFQKLYSGKTDKKSKS
jgi:hypothetical protein